MKLTGLFALLLYIIATSTSAQTRLIVESTPAFLTNNERLFLAASFNEWDPGDLRYELKKQENDTYTINLPDTLNQFEYKITQGSWALAEGTKKGEKIGNRRFIRSANTSDTIRISIEGWESKPTYRFVVTRIPENTPKDAQIYITGNFNNWDPGMEVYRLRKQMDNTYRISVVSELSRLEYKFTRGDWNSVEGKQTGRALPNRVLERAQAGEQKDVNIEILTWEDFSGTFNFFSIYDLLLLFSAFQCVLLMIAIPSMQDYNRRANYWLVISIAFIAVMIFIHVIANYRGVAQSNTKLLLVPDFAMFLYAPLFYFYLRNLLFKTPILPRQWWWHFILPSIQVFLYMPYFLMEHKELQILIVNKDSTMYLMFISLGFIGLVSNTYYWFLCRRTMRTYHREYTTLASHEQNIQYLQTVLIIQAICLLIWLFSGALMLFNHLEISNTYATYETSVDTIWLAFSLIPYFLGYFAIHQPEIFKIPNKEDLSLFKTDKEHTAETISQQTVQDESKEKEFEQIWLEWQPKIELYMTQEKPHHNPGLTLGELAGKLKMPPHQLSRIINEGYHKNFFDFINTYRIEDFKMQYEDPKNKHFTMLAIAFEVGFNSKTAFNRAFKKMTGSTPREYFYDSRVED
ncbi:helix-turn-helix domain-containing protein [Dyadobacter tibetensis]|uniref:helix-turn-helix domain-containing protein n=1 Tax=Dyadobacter tibetensis TaxID=1211851 RepID=UPI0005C611B5|nr:helix-turn-helix domain-containing protein [Dyadobacter tibetensis]